MDNSFKILSFNGSHRSEEGFTDIVLSSFLQGAMSANAQCEVLYPSKQKIATCSGCGKCMFETPGVCNYTDDMTSVIAKMEQTDFLVFASPVYFDSMSSNLKKLIERLRVTLGAHFEFRIGRTYHVKRNKKEQKVVLIFTSGNPEEESFITISRIFHRIIDNMGWQLAGELHFPASHLLVTDPDLLLNQMKAVAMCGAEMATHGAIRKESLEAANKKYVNDPEAILEQMTQTILRIRKDRASGVC
ncbi:MULTISPECIES: flavodoxin family protein [unclassified Pseudodesulfovibrio]|uniref:flavodoxin family protein n=1 Tax=unclassified Pseudodesulfovibrio TaxID=2661612 RepID=UPI000FEB8562|nr:MULTISPECIES: flavodoxin family protein [unclassified Pseudodesulfovibrio]MCJ2163967.1 flavodoxin family protein [Pseudodesulfovibrio sp. S3-i]RWU05788.1 flavodoxin family protein [Pseudodesulfovibrio sp. S3]